MWGIYKKIWVRTAVLFGMIVLLSVIWVIASINNGQITINNSYQSTGEEAQEEIGMVARVIDGDTVDLEDGRRVRYIGIDTPEMKRDCFSLEATERNRVLVFGKEVRLVKDVSETDRYGRILRYVYRGDELINETLVREGYARAVAIKPDTKLYGKFKEAQTEARAEERGMWAEGMCSTVESVSGFSAPLERASERITKKPFGIFITPEDSPVEPERFSGYHTGTDFEILPGEEMEEVSVRAICSGEIVLKQFVSGYGGVVAERCDYEGGPIAVLYGHLSLSSVNQSVGESVESGETVGTLGQPDEDETDGERKHLHLGIYKGNAVNLRGYVSSEVSLEQWIDPCILVCT